METTTPVEGKPATEVKKAPKKVKIQKASKRKRAEAAAAAADAEEDTTTQDGAETPSKRRKTSKASETTETMNTEPKEDPAIEYLQAWKNDNDNWKFKKVRDVWLMQNIYEISKINDEAFKILVKYLKKAPEARRKDLKKQAKKLISKLEKEKEAKKSAAEAAGETAEIPENPVLGRAKIIKKKMKKSLKK